MYAMEYTINNSRMNYPIPIEGLLIGKRQDHYSAWAVKDGIQVIVHCQQGPHKLLTIDDDLKEIKQQNYITPIERTSLIFCGRYILVVSNNILQIHFSEFFNQAQPYHTISLKEDYAIRAALSEDQKSLAILCTHKQKQSDAFCIILNMSERSQMEKKLDGHFPFPVKVCDIGWVKKYCIIAAKSFKDRMCIMNLFEDRSSSIEVKVNDPTASNPDIACISFCSSYLCCSIKLGTRGYVVLCDGITGYPYGQIAIGENVIVDNPPYNPQIIIAHNILVYKTSSHKIFLIDLSTGMITHMTDTNAQAFIFFLVRGNIYEQNEDKLILVNSTPKSLNPRFFLEKEAEKTPPGQTYFRMMGISFKALKLRETGGKNLLSA